ncbi:hypothetical protein COB64_00770 [Candidatus Wolfebacteria bacterium]|nr:MAG: hypothetical protein COB64_00770 [Candidatus Wolfebacteria bacterium]
MKENKITIEINKPISEVFNFTITPENTHKWIDSIEKEETSDHNIKVGTKYKNVNKEGEWSEYIVTKFEKDKLFELQKSDGDLHVRYTYTHLGENKTSLEYFEWTEKTQLNHPFSVDVLEKLKIILE